MRILHLKDQVTIEIVSDDWDRHLAQKKIAHIKALSTGNYSYNPASKNWIVMNIPEYKKYFRRFKKDLKQSHEYQPIQPRLYLDEFYVHG